MSPINFVFFGTPERARRTLEILKEHSLIPSLIVTNPDRPAGRGQQLHESEVKQWAKENSIEYVQPEKIDEELKEVLRRREYDMFIVVAYGKILPKWLIDLPRKGVLNIHYSLLPLYRGATPVETQILEGTPMTGVTIILIDEKVDHGPILAQEALPMPNPLPTNPELTDLLSDMGGHLLAKTMREWQEESIVPQEQDHSQATHTRKFDKAEGELDLSADPLTNFRKIQAFQPWPSTYFFDENRKRIKITEAHLENGALIIDRVIPEGKGEMNYSDYKNI